MRMVFRGFESNIDLRKDAINVLRVQDRALYARCCLSLSQMFADGVPEPAAFYDDFDKELKAKDCLVFAGDLLTLDLNEREIISKAAKKIAQMLIDDQATLARMESNNYAIEDIFAEAFFQMTADYTFRNDWDIGKYLKAFGFGVDTSESDTLYEKACQYLRISADLFPGKVIAFVNLNTFLSQDEYCGICECIVAEELIVLSYEVGKDSKFMDLENGLFIDMNYLE